MTTSLKSTIKKLLLSVALLITSQASASSYDVIYRFENSIPGSNEYFVIKIDFDYVSPDDPVDPYTQQVFSFLEFEQLYYDSDNVAHPVFYFEIVVVETNLPVEPGATSIGSTDITATIAPMSSRFVIGPSLYLQSNFINIEPENFPTGWELGFQLFLTGSLDQSYVLTEITAVPLPAALPLFGACMLLLARLKQPALR